MFHEELILFLTNKGNKNLNLDNDRKDLITFNIDKITAKILGYFEIFLINKLSANIMLQDYLEISSKIRDHQPCKVINLTDSEFEHYDVNDIYKIKELLIFIKNLIIDYLKDNGFDHKININIKDLKGESKSLNIPITNNILSLKKYISNNTDKKISQIILLFNGKALKNETVFLTSGIKENDTIYVIYKIISMEEEIISSSSKDDEIVDLL
jgi:hypothetical protein